MPAFDDTNRYAAAGEPERRRQADQAGTDDEHLRPGVASVCSHIAADATAMPVLGLPPRSRYQRAETSWCLTSPRWRSARPLRRRPIASKASRMAT